MSQIGAHIDWTPGIPAGTDYMALCDRQRETIKRLDAKILELRGLVPDGVTPLVYAIHGAPPGYQIRWRGDAWHLSDSWEHFTTPADALASYRARQKVSELTETTTPLRYGVRKCRDHWHVTVSGEDVLTRPNELTLDEAMSRAGALNGQASAVQPSDSTEMPEEVDLEIAYTLKGLQSGSLRGEPYNTVRWLASDRERLIRERDAFDEERNALEAELSRKVSARDFQIQRLIRERDEARGEAAELLAMADVSDHIMRGAVLGENEACALLLDARRDDARLLDTSGGHELEQGAKAIRARARTSKDGGASK